MDSDDVHSHSAQPAGPQGPEMRRIKVWQETVNFCRGKLLPPQSVKFQLRPNFKFRNEGRYQTVINVVDMDSFDAGRQLCEYGLQPAVLSFSDDWRPGSNVDAGASSQEAELFRRSNMHLTLRSDLYPLTHHPAQCLYNKDVTIFRDGPAGNYAFVKPITVSCISCPGLHKPVLTPDGDLQAIDKEKLRNKIRLILQIAAIYSHDSICLGALGCLEWSSPAQPTARAFKEVLSQEARGVFKIILFPIKHKPLYTTFLEELDGLQQ
eukprot:jgi/Astpho2/5818/Aster-x1320